MDEGEKEAFLEKGSPSPPHAPPLLSKNFYQGDGKGQGLIFQPTHCSRQGRPDAKGPGVPPGIPGSRAA